MNMQHIFFTLLIISYSSSLVGMYHPFNPQKHLQQTLTHKLENLKRKKEQETYSVAKETSLHWFLSAGKLDKASELKEIKNINDQDADGNTYFHNIIEAWGKGRYPLRKSQLGIIITWLVEKQFNFNLKNKKGQNALEYAHEFIEEETVFDVYKMISEAGLIFSSTTRANIASQSIPLLQHSFSPPVPSTTLQMPRLFSPFAQPNSPFQPPHSIELAKTSVETEKQKPLSFPQIEPDIEEAIFPESKKPRIGYAPHQ